jgi:hypothetical protein
MFGAPAATPDNPNPLPERARLAQFATALPAGPVDLKVFPSGDVVFVTYQPGGVYRITPKERVDVSMTASALFGPLPMTVQFSAAANGTAPPVTISWDLNGDGTYGDSTDASPSFTYTTAGAVQVSVRADDAAGFMNVARVTVWRGALGCGVWW